MKSIHIKALIKLRKIIFCGLFSMLPFVVYAQDEPPLLGAEIRPMIPSSLFDVRAQEFSYKNRNFTLNAPVGYSAGAVIRLNLSKLWNLESGIYYTSRTYRSAFKDSLGNTSTGKVIFDNYELPFSALIYIRLSKHVYINNAFGLSIDFFPTDAQSPDNGSYYQKIAKHYWILPALMANIGAEYRTKNYGYFYIGALYHRMLIPMGQTGFFFSNNGFSDYVTAPVQGHYFSIDFKYFFSNNRTPEINNGVGMITLPQHPL